ncbi:MAG: class E sortase [Actinobacteria bacterium]|nr:class E sortase [Actinomycetota bacterium]
MSSVPDTVVEVENGVSPNGTGLPAKPEDRLPERARRRWVARSGRPPTFARAVATAGGVSLFVLAAWSIVYLLVLTNVEHARSQRKLYATFRSDAAQALAPVGGSIAPGTGVALISIPRAGLHDEVVVEGTTSDNLEDGPGHLRDTPLPGQPGVSVIFGRASLFGAPFHNIPLLSKGDSIDVTTGQGKFRYVIDDIRQPSAPTPAPPKTGSRLTLVTSRSTGWPVGVSAIRAIYVDATLQGQTQPAPTGRPTAVVSNEQVMAGDTGAITWMQIVLWLQLLVAVMTLLAWVQTRWQRSQVWLVGFPVLLAVLWGLSTTAVRVLPNLM